MTTRILRNPLVLSAALLLVHAVPKAEQARAQEAGPPPPSVAPPPAEAEGATGAPADAEANGAPEPATAASSRLDAEANPPLPTQAEPVMGVPSSAAAAAVETTPAPTEPTRRDEPTFVSQDGGGARKVKPLFEVGSYHFQASGYVQGQYQNVQGSENQLSSDGLRLQNSTGFFVPRARIVVEGANEWSGAVLEYDIANVNGQFMGVQRAEATLHWRNPKSAVPYLATTFGVFRTPFGSEAALSARLRYYADNATVTQAFFPGQSDLGFRAEGGVAWFRYALAFVNGHPINEPRWGGRAPTKQGDALGRLGIDADLGAVRIVAGASALKGRGFSPGSPATKDTVTVRDVGENGIIAANSLTLLPGHAAVPSRTFERWGAGVDAQINGNVSSYWNFTVRGEFMFGQNLDRGFFIADPIALGYDNRAYGGVASFDNLIYQVGLLGFRYDMYNPNPDGTASVGTRVVKSSRQIATATFLAGLQLPGTNTRLFAEYDRVKDHLGLSTDGRPADIKNNRFLLRLQVSLW
jgi:hypothetical protein